MALPRAPPIPNPAGKRAEKCLSISSVKAARQGLHPPALLFATRSPVQTEDTTRTKLRPEQAVRDLATLPLNRAAPRAPRAIVAARMRLCKRWPAATAFGGCRR